METFFYRYRKFLLVLSIIMLVFFPFELYRGVLDFNAGQTWRGVGVCLNGLVYLLVAIALLVNIKNTRKKQTNGESLS